MPSIRTHAELFALLACLSLPGCQKDLSPPLGDLDPGAPARGGTLSLATFVHVRSIDPAVAFDEGSEPIVRLLFARLFRVSRNGVIEGDLVESHRLSNDGRRLTMRLRSGALFHDGSPVLAADVKRSLERTLHGDTPCPVPSFYDGIVGFEAYRKGEADELAGIQVLSERVLRIEIDEPDATLLPTLTLGFAAPVCPSAGRRYDPEFAMKACGAGPFRLVKWEGQEAVELARHDGYYETGRIHLDRIRWLFGVRSTSQRFRFERGGLDFVHELTASDAVAFRSDPRWKPLGHWSRPRSTRGIFMNTQMPPFDRVEVRRAVALAIDRKQIASLRAGHLVAANSVIPSGVVGHDPAFRGQEHDLSRARELMRRAGYAYDPGTGDGGYPETIDYYCAAESFDVAVAQVFQQQLARIGIRIRIKAVSWPAYLAITGRRGEARMGADGWSADFDDPADFFDPLFSTEAIQDEESQNRAFFSDPELDALLDRARREMDPQARRRMYDRADAIVRDQAPWAVVYGFRYYDVHQGYVHGYEPHPHAYLDVASVWIDAEHREMAHRARGAPPASMSAFALDLLSGGRR